jgi:hypothetical protein
MCTSEVRIGWADKSFSVIRYSCCRSNSWSTEPVMYANSFFQPISLSTSALSVHIDREYARYEGGRQAEEPAMVGSSLLVKRCVRITRATRPIRCVPRSLPRFWTMAQVWRMSRAQPDMPIRQRRSGTIVEGTIRRSQRVLSRIIEGGARQGHPDRRGARQQRTSVEPYGCTAHT